MQHTYPRLVTDIGGTHARFTIEVAPFEYQSTKTFICKDYPTLSGAIISYLESVDQRYIKHIALALPTPIVDDILFMVNSPWHNFSMLQTKREVGAETMIFLNDFHALALSVPHISKEYLIQIGGSIQPDSNKPIAIIGPGTGLGMATLIRNPINNSYLAISAEGGRSSFPAVTEEEFELWKFIHKRFHHVSVERILSGPGLQLTYEALCSIKGINIDTLPTAAEITSKGISNECYISKQVVDHFCRILGTVASNLAVITNSFGGVYLGGGIIPQILEYFCISDFRCRFEDKGRYRPFLAKMPVYAITHKYPALLGSSYALDTYLNHNYIP